ncbi:CRK20 [Symbiodinium natans]|uniref:CRK20 protein n=1 Tax=Symbiodinium natans TaxID=878477 RepID=A0A812UT30_9DINO|nr:CRK20 [Symbiodinium natans]
MPRNKYIHMPYLPICMLYMYMHLYAYCRCRHQGPLGTAQAACSVQAWMAGAGGGALLAALAAALADDDPSDQLPMTCCKCGERCANRAESWAHTHATGHREFRSCLADEQDEHSQLPRECQSCDRRCANQAEARAHARESGHDQFRVRGHHCYHCAGLAARCSCSHGCPKPAGARCDTRQSDHCEHCRGRAGTCACHEGCPQTARSRCLQLGGPGATQQERTGHRFNGDQCGVCRECGMCTWRLTSRSGRKCMNDGTRPAAHRPRICGCGGGPSVCSACGVGPCCARTPCDQPRPPPPPPTPPTLRSLRRDRSGPRAGNAQDNALDEDLQLAQAIAQSLDSPAAHLSERERREAEDLEMAIALSLSESSPAQHPAPRPAPKPKPAPAPAPAPAMPAAPLPPAPPTAAPSPPSVPSRPATPALVRSPAIPEAPGHLPYDYIARCTGNFSPDRALGTGAYGTVYHGVDMTSEGLVEFAAKRMECEDPDQRVCLERMTEAEIRVNTAFAHPNIVRLIGFCFDMGAVLVYELLPEGSLDGHLCADDSAARLTWGRRSSIVSGLLAAVSYLHNHDSRGPCYHRDIKPGNIMLSAAFSPKLGDCGLSRFLPQDRPGQSRATMQMTTARGFRGTPGFMCPRYIDTGAFNDKSEVYSIGVTILQLITAQMDFAAELPDGSTLRDLIEEADGERIAANHDRRVALGASADVVQRLSSMAAAAVERFPRRVRLLPLLRQAREAREGGATEVAEVTALKSEVERMSAELRGLRLQEQVAQLARAEAAEAERAERRQCELCFEEASLDVNSLVCPNGHLICTDCAPEMVRTFLERVGASDAMLDDHRERGGFIPCVRRHPAFQPQCNSHYTDQWLARALPDEVFVAYRAAQDEVTENRIWEQHNHRFQEEVARIQQQYESEQSARREHAASAEFLRRRYPNAKMCPRCSCGPVINENCFDLQSHHNEAVGRSRINNACRQCGFFTRDWNQWLPWDGVLREATG